MALTPEQINSISTSRDGDGFLAPANFTAGSATSQESATSQFNKVMAQYGDLNQSLIKSSSPSSLFGKMTNYLAKQEANLVKEIDEVLTNRDSAQYMDVVKKQADFNMEQGLSAKVIGKCTSAVDQLTKLN